MSRTQIGHALQYKDPANAIKNIHNKNYDRFEKYSVVLTGAQFEPPLRNNIRAQGSQHAKRYYMSLTTLINRR